MAELIIVRGLPGSGKSTIAEDFKPYGYVHYEADMYHMVDGEYKFDINNIGEAHEWCQAQTEDSLRRGDSVIVSNTFTRYWEMVPYFNLAKKYDAHVSIIEAKGKFDTIHGVPKETQNDMAQRWESYK
jgi:predicted kinase